MKKLNLLACVLIAFVVTIVSCSKGDTGPAGAAVPGSDSVTYSNWTTLNMTDEGQDTSSGLEIYYQAISAPAITQSILDKGIIIGYLSFVDNNGVTNVVNADSYFNPELFIPGEIDLTSFGVDWSQYSYRYVIIPGTIATGNSILRGLTKEQLKKVDYVTITKALGISITKTTN